MKSSFIPSHNENYEILSHENYSAFVEKETGIQYEYGITLARKFTKHDTKFVTWEYSIESFEGNLIKRNFYWGHYYDSKYIALIDYHERLSNFYRLNIIDFKGED